MAITKALSNISKGTEFTKPELSLQYIVGATFGVIVLLFVWKAGNAIFAKGSSVVQSSIPGATSTLDYRAALGIV